MYLGLIIFSIYISFIDLKSHRIPNRAIFFAFIYFLVFTVLQGKVVYPTSALISLICAPILLKFKVGAGDIKLFMILSTFFLPNTFEIAVAFLTAFSAIAALLTLITTVKERTLRTSVALAPAICGAFIWCAS